MRTVTNAVAGFVTNSMIMLPGNGFTALNVIGALNPPTGFTTILNGVNAERGSAHVVGKLLNKKSGAGGAVTLMLSVAVRTTEPSVTRTVMGCTPIGVAVGLRLMNATVAVVGDNAGTAMDWSGASVTVIVRGEPTKVPVRSKLSCTEVVCPCGAVNCCSANTAVKSPGGAVTDNATVTVCTTVPAVAWTVMVRFPAVRLPLPVNCSTLEVPLVTIEGVNIAVMPGGGFGTFSVTAPTFPVRTTLMVVDTGVLEFPGIMSDAGLAESVILGGGAMVNCTVALRDTPFAVPVTVTVAGVVVATALFETSVMRLTVPVTVDCENVAVTLTGSPLTLNAMAPTSGDPVLPNVIPTVSLPDVVSVIAGGESSNEIFGAGSAALTTTSTGVAIDTPLPVATNCAAYVVMVAVAGGVME